MDIYTEGQIEAYLKGRLSPEAAAEIEQRLAADPAFAAEFNLHKAAVEAIISRGKARELVAKIEKKLEEEGFFEQYKKDKIQDEDKPRPNSGQKDGKWLRWAAVLLIMLMSLAAFQQYQIRERIARIEEHLNLNDTLPRVHRIEDHSLQQDTEIAEIKLALEQQDELLTTHWSRVDSVLKSYGIRDMGGLECRLSPEERKKWYADFLRQETNAMVTAGTKTDAKPWRELLKAKNDSTTLQILRDMAETSPKEVTPLEYYILGVMCLLYEQNHSGAVWYLEKAKGVMRPYHAKFLLAAYLENDQQAKAKAWATEQSIPRDQWPKGAVRCLK